MGDGVQPVVLRVLRGGIAVIPGVQQVDLLKAQGQEGSQGIRVGIGEIAVPAERHWGAQTQRSLENFKIGGQRQPREIIAAFALLGEAQGRGVLEVGPANADQVRVSRFQPAEGPRQPLQGSGTGSSPLSSGRRAAAPRRI